MRIQFETPQFLILLFVSFLAVIISTAYIFFVKNDYSYFVEGVCNLETTTCFYRNCSEEDSCYEYQEEIYKTYQIEATEFKKCGGLACTEQCESGAIQCTEITCNSEEEECYSPEEYENSTEVEGDTEIKEENPS